MILIKKKSTNYNTVRLIISKRHLNDNLCIFLNKRAYWTAAKTKGYFIFETPKHSFTNIEQQLTKEYGASII